VTDLDSLAHWRYSVDDSGVGWLLIDRADEETNSLGRAVMDELDRVVTYLEANLPKGLVLMSGKSSGFIVGADIREFDDYTDVVEVNGLITGAHELFQRFEDLGCYKVVAIDGFCLGGGLELATAACVGTRCARCSAAAKAATRRAWRSWQIPARPARRCRV